MPSEENSAARLLRENPALLAAAEMKDLIDTNVEKLNVLLANSLNNLLHHLKDKPKRLRVQRAQRTWLVGLLA